MTVKFSKENDLFQSFFFQRWGFFAPPPTYNDRLYYVFYKKQETRDRKIIPREICKNLFAEKSKKAPFNNEEDIMDYIISNSLITITEEITRFKNIKGYANLYQGDNILRHKSDSALNRFFTDYITKTGAYKSLLNYSGLIARSDPTLGAVDSVEIWILRKDIPQFAFRDSVFRESNETIVYKSKKTNIPPVDAVKN